MTVLFSVAPVKKALAPLLAHTYPNVDLTPISRTTSLAARKTRRQGLSKLIEDFDATIDAVALLEASLASLIIGLKQRRASVRMALAPIASLPAETLREIFLIAAANDSTSRASVNISHVSSHWRTVSLDIKELWTTICYPGLLHEFSERSKGLRIHLTPALNARWPADLEITAAEASRLSTWSLRESACVGGQFIGAPPIRFTSALRRYTRLLELRRVTIAGPEGAHGDSSFDKALQLTDEEEEIWCFARKDQLSELGLSNVSVSVCNDWLQSCRHGRAPLSRLRFSAVFADFLGWDDLNDYTSDSYRIRAPECDQLESLTVIGCCKDIHLQMLANWVMPGLKSLTLDVRDIEEEYQQFDGSLSRSLQILFSRSPELETLDITCDLVTDNLVKAFWPTSEGAAYPVPRLRDIRICCPEDIISETGDAIMQMFESRAKPLSNAASARTLVVDEFGVNIDETKPYRVLHCSYTTETL